VVERMLKERCVALPTAFVGERSHANSCHQPGFANATCIAFPGVPPVTCVIVPEPLLLTVPSVRRAPDVSPS